MQTWHQVRAPAPTFGAACLQGSLGAGGQGLVVHRPLKREGHKHFCHVLQPPDQNVAVLVAVFQAPQEDLQLAKGSGVHGVEDGRPCKFGLGGHSVDHDRRLPGRRVCWMGADACDPLGCVRQWLRLDGRLAHDGSEIHTHTHTRRPPCSAVMLALSTSTLPHLTHLSCLPFLVASLGHALCSSATCVVMGCVQ